MVNMLHQAFIGDNIGSPSTAQQFGPYTTAVGVNHLVRVRAVASFSFAGISLAPSAVLENFVAWGVQVSPSGFTPLVLPAQIGGDTFLWSEIFDASGTTGAAWTPSTNDVGWIGYAGVAKEWRGQLAGGDFLDFYLTTGATVAGAPSWGTSFSLEFDVSY